MFGPSASSSREASACAVMLEMAFLPQEHLRVSYLIKEDCRTYRTGLPGNGRYVRGRAAAFFCAAVSRNIPSFIVVHNHPSGDPNLNPQR
jgi:DNA repair protein RadC